MLHFISAFHQRSFVNSHNVTDNGPFFTFPVFSETKVICLVQIPTLVIFALDYLYGVFSVFGPSVQMSMKHEECVSNFSLPDGTHL